MGDALLLCRSQTEAMGIRRHLATQGILSELVRPPRQSTGDSCTFAVRVPEYRLEDARQTLRALGIVPCRIVSAEGGA